MPRAANRAREQALRACETVVILFGQVTWVTMFVAAAAEGEFH